FEIALAALVFDDVAEVDDELGTLDLVHPSDEATGELFCPMGELAELARVVRGRAEVCVRNQRDAHAPHDDNRAARALLVRRTANRETHTANPPLGNRPGRSRSRAPGVRAAELPQDAPTRGDARRGSAPGHRNAGKGATAHAAIASSERDRDREQRGR